LCHQILGFKKELKILRKIKMLQLIDNGGFPYLLSSKISKNYGEILMTYVGCDIFTHFKIESKIENR
jgi:hypothetical protein